MRTGEFGVDAESRLREIDRSGIFFSSSRRPLSINSVFEGFRQRRFEVIQEEICLTRRLTEDDLWIQRGCLESIQELNNWVSSAYRLWSTEDALMSELSGLV